MPFCPKCDAYVAPDDSFCSSCGAKQPEGVDHARPPQGDRRQYGDRRRQADRRGQAGQSQREPRRAPFAPALETEEGRKSYAALWAEKTESRRETRAMFRWIVLALLVAAGVLWLTNSDYYVGALAAAGVFTLFCFGSGPGRWSETEYYLIHGSRDEEGNHRCIKCGGRGIFRQGAYKSVEVEASCSKCGQHLWQEYKSN